MTSFFREVEQDLKGSRSQVAVAFIVREYDLLPAARFLTHILHEACREVREVREVPMIHRYRVLSHIEEHHFRQTVMHGLDFPFVDHSVFYDAIQHVVLLDDEQRA